LSTCINLQFIGVGAINDRISKNAVWKPQLKINGAVQVPAYGLFEKKLFDTKEKAIAYAKKAGEFIVDGGSSGDPRGCK
jgi:hypothetical protein